MSIKECFHVRGCDSTAGLTQYLFRPNKNDGGTVNVLRRNGAVPFCMTNVPQTMMGYQCSNPCFGSSGIFIKRQLLIFGGKYLMFCVKSQCMNFCVFHFKETHMILTERLEDHLEARDL